MKITYLVRRANGDGSFKLDIASEEEWEEIKKANKILPSEQRRYFAMDRIREDGEIDIMYYEVSKAEHAAWNAEHTARRRNEKVGQQYRKLSLDAPCDDMAGFSLADIIISDINETEIVEEKCYIDQIRSALRRWRPWAEDFLELYLDGQEKGSAQLVAMKYGVSTRQGRTYKKCFEDFLVKLISEFQG